MRIVSLIPSATEIVCALGAGDQLAGRSHECDFPAGVTALPALTRPRLPLSGGSRAIAGAKGNVDARIFTTLLQAELLSIAGVHRTTEELPAGVAGRAAMVRLAFDSLHIEALEGGA